MVEHAKRESRRAITEKRQEFEARLTKIRKEEEGLKQAQDSTERPRKKQVCRYCWDSIERTLNQLRKIAIGAFST
jgi:phage terminase Nu1 subunit (DNA packaging protein)